MDKKWYYLIIGFICEILLLLCFLDKRLGIPLLIVAGIGLYLIFYFVKLDQEKPELSHAKTM